MPNIFKSFLKPAVDQYVFKDVDDIIIEPPPPPPEENPPEPPRELTPEESEEKANADSVISFAKVQADEILADARRQAEELLEQQLALITTFYGSMMAHVIFNPIAANLAARDEEEIVCREIILEGIMAIQSGENPKFLRERLLTFMQQKQRDKEGGKRRREEE